MGSYFGGGQAVVTELDPLSLLENEDLEDESYGVTASTVISLRIITIKLY